MCRVRAMMQFLATGGPQQGPRPDLEKSRKKERVWRRTASATSQGQPCTFLGFAQCPPLTCVNTSVQMRMYTNIHHHLHDPHGRIKPSHFCAHKTSEYCVMDILCTCNFVRIYMHEEGFAEVRVGRAYTRNILMEICFFQFLSACPPFPCYSGICMKSS